MNARLENRIEASGIVVSVHLLPNPWIRLYVKPAISPKERIEGVSRSRNGIYARFLCKEGCSMPQDLRPGDHVFVNGYVQAYDYKDFDTNRWMHMQHMIATEITMQKTSIITSYGIDGGSIYHSSDFTLFCAGKIVYHEHSKDGQWVNLALASAPGYGATRPNTIRASFHKNARVNDNKIAVGDTIATICSLKTSRIFYTDEVTKREAFREREHFRIEDLIIVEHSKTGADTKEELTGALFPEARWE